MLGYLLYCIEMVEHIAKHGDSVKDIAFQVEDLDAIFKVTVLWITCVDFIIGHVVIYEK